MSISSRPRSKSRSPGPRSRSRSPERLFSISTTFGIEEGDQFPNLEVLTADGKICSLYNLTGNHKALVVGQPGASHTDQWKDKKPELDQWLATPGLGGCTAHLQNHVAKNIELHRLGYRTIFILTNKTADQLKDVAKRNNVPATIPVCSLTPNSQKILERLGHPFINFNGNKILGRFTFALDEDAKITRKFDRRDLEPNKSTMAEQDANNTCAELQKLRQEEKDNMDHRPRSP